MAIIEGKQNLVLNMIETTIMEKIPVKKLRKGVLITGLPGIGLIGQVVGRYLVDELKAKKIATLFSPHFPHQVFMTKKGGMRLIRNSFYLCKGKTRDIVVLVGDIQAMSSVGQYEVAGKTLDYCRKIGVSEILTVGGYSTGKISEERRIFGVATSDPLREKLKKFNVIFGEAKGSIVGAAGLLPALCKFKDMEGACIMGETHGGYIDTASARQITLMLSKYLDIKVNLKKLNERAEESQKVLKKVQDEVQKTMEAQNEAMSRNVTYIR
ncbi:PAC2 family protein [Candidatus Bilamarchaeum dharawalense]|uniref:PAC2 family protein n=1 Tax=Candidatus Bilamarchaeum dharawalense TaxID=2885759 RepID=A0A5E4LY56_9ARCH|nr:PAC2 family protein [Candidatus Bilamarchaeum dharawalense]